MKLSQTPAAKRKLVKVLDSPADVPQVASIANSQMDGHTIKVKKSHKKQVTAEQIEISPAAKRQRQQTKPSEIPAKSSPHKAKQPTAAERHALQRQEMAIIMSRISKDGFELRNVEPDGSCLFRALSMQVNGGSFFDTLSGLRVFFSVQCLALFQFVYCCTLCRGEPFVTFFIVAHYVEENPV